MRISDWSSDVCSSDLVARAELEALGEQAAGQKKERARRESGTARGSLPAHLTRIEEVILPDEQECPCCGGALHCIDSDISSRLDVIPVQYRVIVTSRPDRKSTRLNSSH